MPRCEEQRDDQPHQQSDTLKASIRAFHLSDCQKLKQPELVRIQGTRTFGRAQNKRWLAVCPPPHSMLCPPCLSPGPLPVCCRSPHVPLRLVTPHATATSLAAAMEGAPRTAAGSQRDHSYGCQQVSCVKMPYMDTILGRQGHPYVQEHECTEMVVSRLLVIFKKVGTPQCPTEEVK